MRLGAHNTLGTEMSGSDSENLEISISPLLEKHPDAQSLVSSLNLTSELSLAQQKGQAEVDLYRIWYLLLNLNIFKIYCLNGETLRWERYDRMTSGGEETTAWWGKMKDDRDKMSSTFVLSLVAFLFALSFLIVMIMVICKKCKRRRAAKLAASSLSLPPPYEVIVLLCTVKSLFFLHCNVNDPLLFEMVVEEKERLATETGLPSYKEACRSNLS